MLQLLIFSLFKEMIIVLERVLFIFLFVFLSGKPVSSLFTICLDKYLLIAFIYILQFNWILSKVLFCQG